MPCFFKRHICLFLFSFLLFFSCDLIEYHPYDGDLDSDASRDVNVTNIALIETACEGKDTIRFILMGDTQRNYDETEDFVDHVNQLSGIDFVIHGGDYTEYGLTREFEWNDEILSKLEIPYVGLIGNHDILANGEDVYREMFGDENFSFVVNDVKFVCLNTNALEYEDSTYVPDFDYIQQEIADSTSHKRTVVVMHAPPASEQFISEEVEDLFQSTIRQFPTLMFCLHAHNHTVSAVDIFDDGIIYYGCANIAQRKYHLFTITPDDYAYEVVDF